MLSKIKNSYLRILLIVCAIVLIFMNKGYLLSKFSSTKILSSSYSEVAEKVRISCLEEVQTYGSKENCYANKFNTIGEKNGPDYSFKVLFELQKKDRGAIGCHLISHGIGAGSFKRDPENWRSIIQNMTTICNYGGIHGVIESYIGSLPDKSLKRDVIPTICGDTPRADCNHIVGHLLLVETDADINKALDLCEVFTEKNQNDFCISGVFMEFQTALNLIEHNLVPKSWLNWPARVGDLEKICRSYSGKRAEGCWEEIVHVALVKFNNDPKKIFDFCSTAQVPEGAKKCKRHSIGIMGAAKNFNLALLQPMCTLPQKEDPNFENDCYSALVGSTLSTVATALPDTVSFCSNLPNEFKESCFSMLAAFSNSGVFRKEELIKECSKVPKDWYNYCTGIEKSNIQLRSND